MVLYRPERVYLVKALHNFHEVACLVRNDAKMSLRYPDLPAMQAFAETRQK